MAAACIVFESVKVYVPILEIQDYNLMQLFTNGADCEGLASMYCSTMVGAWTVGYPGSCMYGSNYGYRIGRSSYKMALVEVKFNIFKLFI